jgi:hypothetical protein
MQLDDLETAEEAGEGNGAEEQSDEALPGEADGGVVDRYKTILYFLKDTDASVAFWERLAFQMKDYRLQAEYCSGELERREFIRGIEVPPRLAPFSYRSAAFPEARLVRQLRYDRTVLPATRFGSGQLRFPVRTVPGPAFSHFGLDDFERIPSRSLLATFEGADLIRELELPLARLILVYNSESFLNHSMVYSGNRELSQALIRHALRNARNAGMWAPGETLQVALVRNRLMASQEAARDDFDIWRFLKVFPLNVIVFHFLGILLLFLLSRWPHSQPPLENPGSGTREFLEHIRALGVRLGRTRSRIKALEPLLKYKQKTTGRDYSAVIQKLEEDAE